MLNPLKTGGNGSRSGAGVIDIRAGDRSFTVVRTGREYSQDWADALNAAKARDDVEWAVDTSGNVRLRDVKVVTPFEQFMHRAKLRVLSPDELRNASFHWKNIAVERGYLRHLGDHRYEVRYEPKRDYDEMQEAAA
ncbi:hypothetical protein GCM10007897_31890 [Sphingobium jiangsuense]|uniref:Uncharacterized protein n=1 Tax=Sphingobium jiangsuense TaxID=870476 RepID=A0A7W6FS32_9SPHN|nr:hypothetical protein [Sphingobium jiangsuense]MBB3928302.1 hypothetical protein [Sphingobium jiangsuense]GLT01791.1 hypothetical protein GCM10007897_31890 [Sphingobium jiangsuense]